MTVEALHGWQGSKRRFIGANMPRSATVSMPMSRIADSARWRPDPLAVKTVPIMTDESPTIPVSWGELADKISILEIKCARMRAPAAVANAARELAALAAVLAPVVDGIAAECAALTLVNTRLWDIEDAIREKEAAQDFGAAFVALARSVYRENDERGRIKAAINRVLRSALVEEKQYSAY